MECHGRQIHGLTATQVEENRRIYGCNILTPPPKPSLWRKFLTYLNDPLIKILIAALVLSIGIAVYEYVTCASGAEAFLEPAGILVAILMATIIGFSVEVSADKKFEILNHVNDDVPVKVIRDGCFTQTARRDVVKGDMVVLETGDEIPADGALLDSMELTVNESTLTGEPQVHKSHKQEDADSEATYPTDMVLRGTSVIEGHALMEVTAVGDATEYGKVYEASQIETGVKTPLSLQFERLGKMISFFAIVVGILIVIGRLAIYDWGGDRIDDDITYVLHTVMIAVTLIVVSVPEGLPMSVTLSLALSMRRMLASNNLVRKLHACETMGAATVICTDKTGTLTRNQMRVSETWFPGLSSAQKLDDDEFSSMIKEGISVNSTAYLERLDEGKHVRVLGNPTEGALLLWLDGQNVDYLKSRAGAETIDQMPFSTQRKFMATVVHSRISGRKMVYVKGAPEIVLDMCGRTWGNVDRNDIKDRLSQYQNRAMRTLGFACAIVPEDCGEVFADGRIMVDELVFIGICAISDPVRPEVPLAISGCIKAGISVKIITGDTPGTAKEIGRQVGLWTDTDTDINHISGPDFAALSDEEARHRARSLKIMSRARPTDKSRLVRLLQDDGEVVAVTGDGTNDAPALNAAQVGLSMGDGTSVAKQASDITILDNSFASISKAVMWGRSLYQNIQRFILFQLTVNVVACLIVLIGAFTGKDSPLTVTQILWVNLIMDTFAALALASLPPNKEVMDRKPRRTDDFIITGAMWRRIIGVGLFFTLLLFGLMQYMRAENIDSLLEFDFVRLCRSLYDFSGEDMSTYDLTLFFNFFVFVQMWNLFNARTFGSGHSVFHNLGDCRMFLIVVGMITAGQFLIIYCGGEMFNVERLCISDMLITIAVTSLIMIIPQTVNLINAPRRQRCGSF